MRDTPTDTGDSWRFRIKALVDDSQCVKKQQRTEFRQESPELWVFNSDMPAIRWFGLPFALIGLIPLASVLGLIDLGLELGPDAPIGLAVLAGLALFVGVLAAILIQHGTTIDQRAKTLTSWYRIIVPFRQTTYSAGDFTQVAHYKKDIGSNQSRRTVFPVELRAQGKDAGLVRNCGTFLEARGFAEQCGKILGLPVLDCTDGKQHLRQADELDQSLRDQRSKGDMLPGLGLAPARMRSQVKPRGDALLIEIPSSGIKPIHILGFALATGPIWIALLILSSLDEKIPDAFRAMVMIFSSVPCLTLVIPLLSQTKRQWLITVTSKRLRVERRVFGRQVTEIPADELEEISVPDEERSLMQRFVAGGLAITAVSDAVKVDFGAGLPSVELRYLATMIRGVVSAHEQPENLGSPSGGSTGLESRESEKRSGSPAPQFSKAFSDN